MTDRIEHPSIVGLSSALKGAALAALAALLAACASAPEEAMPIGPQAGPINTGTYPNLNVPPESAAAPITDEDKANLDGQIASAKSRQSSAGRGAGAKGNPDYLKKLAQNHGDDTLKQIAAQ